MKNHLLCLLAIFAGCSIGVSLGQPAIATPQPVGTAQTTPAPTKPDSVTQKMLGQWLSKDPIDGDMVMFVFAPDGQAFLVSGQSPKGNALARKIQYQVNTDAEPMAIDFILSKTARVLTVFEFTADNDLRMQVLGTAPGQPRPASLNQEATVFQKISSDTTLPPNTELLPPR